MHRLAVFSLLLIAGCYDPSEGDLPVPPFETGSPLDAAVDAVDAAETTDALVVEAAPLEYPAGPYGFKVGNVFPNVALPGYRAGTGDWVEIAMLEYFDPDGTRGIHGIHLDVESQWCPPSNTLGTWLSKWSATGYTSRGARLLTAMTESSDKNPEGHYLPASRATVDMWVAKYHTNFDIVADEKSASLPTTGSVGLPHRYLIDPRTMRIVRVFEGLDPAVGPCASDDDCCKTADSPDVCSQNYLCSPTWKTCLTPTMAGPIPGLDALMKKNGAPDFPVGLTPPGP